MADNTKNPKNPLDDLDPILKGAFSKSDENESKDIEFDLNEIEESEKETDHSNLEVKMVDFADSKNAEPISSNSDSLIGNLQVTVSVEIGRCKLTVSDIESLCEGALVELDRFVGEPLDLVLNNTVIAQGEVVSVDNKFGLKIKKIINPTEH